ncbi:hypothetical protein Acsp01_78530 [Actinoplanes sp. NBRC 101535]|nr:hypothetical protein Acsp01_78530 [Actinoplanes sp. NBRC 101535]
MVAGRAGVGAEQLGEPGGGGRALGAQPAEQLHAERMGEDADLPAAEVDLGDIFRHECTITVQRIYAQVICMLDSSMGLN